MDIKLAGLPDLQWTHQPSSARLDADTLVLTSEAGVDWTNDASGQEFTFQHRATSLSFLPKAEFQLSARVRVDHPRSTFDAGALTLWADERHWAKICFEWSPQGRAMVVSVVTNEFSDDVNSTEIPADEVYLRVARVGPAYAFHWSADGVRWHFVRLFRLLTTSPVAVGFMAQAPLGDASTARFDFITLRNEPLKNWRDES